MALPLSVQVCHQYPGVPSGHPQVLRGPWEVLGIPMSHQGHHSPTVLPIPKSQGDNGKSLGFPCPTKATTVPQSFPSQSPKGTMGSHTKATTIPLSFPSQSPKGTMGGPQDSYVPTYCLGPVGDPISSPTRVHNGVNFKHNNIDSTMGTFTSIIMS